MNEDKLYSIIDFLNCFKAKCYIATSSQSEHQFSLHSNFDSYLVNYTLMLLVI